jgi:hypothetical protein
MACLGTKGLLFEGLFILKGRMGVMMSVAGICFYFEN